MVTRKKLDTVPTSIDDSNSVGTESQHQLSLPSISDNTASDEKLLKFVKTLRIAVTGDVFLTDLERKIIDEPDFQRLRSVRQLATAYLVFPTALHSRFDHSLGTMMMADRMVKAIEENTASEPAERKILPIQRIIARLYGLLHDLSHVPFGHTIEDELQLFTRHDDNPKRIERFLGPDSAIGKLIITFLGNEGYDRFMRVYLWEDDNEKRAERLADSKQVDVHKDNNSWSKLAKWLSIQDDDIFIHDIVSNTVCADLLDYLARDNYFCNLGISLEYRFLNFLYLQIPQSTTLETKARRRVFVRLWKRIGQRPRRDTLTDLARLLETRYMIAERVYFHHAKIISGAMLGRALQESKRANEITEEQLYSHSDDSLLRTLSLSENGLIRTLGQRLQNRRLYKRVESFGDAEFEQAGLSDHSKSFKKNALDVLTNPDERLIFENELAEHIGTEVGSVLIYAPTDKMNMKHARMRVHWKGNDLELKDIDDKIIRPRLNEILDAHSALWAIWIIADRDKVTLEMEELLIERFKIQFLTPSFKVESRENHYFRKLITRESVSRALPLDGLSAHDLDAIIQSATDTYRATARNNKPHRERLDMALSSALKAFSKD